MMIRFTGSTVLLLVILMGKNKEKSNSNFVCTVKDSELACTTKERDLRVIIHYSMKTE